MRFFVVVFSLLLTCGLGRDLGRGSNSHRISSWISANGYSVKVITVTTEDGYILDLIRIPHGKKTQNFDGVGSDTSSSSSSSSESSQDRSMAVSSKPVVLLMHGMMGSAEDFVYGGPTQGLAYHLADQGYDVFLGNSRGSYYGQRHTKLNPDRDQAFWKYCWDDIGTKDLPAIIDKIISVTKENKINYIGHMEGSTDFFVMASSMPEYNQKIRRMVAMGPIAFLKHSDNAMLKEVAKNMRSGSWIMKNVGMNLFRPSNRLVSDVKRHCLDSHQWPELCDNLYWQFNGFNSPQMNKTIVDVGLKYLPSGGSVMQVKHYAQLMTNGNFAKFQKDEDSEAEDYDLSKVTTPVALMYAPNDFLSQLDDVKALADRLPNLMPQMEMNDFTNNMDLIYAKGVRDVNKKVHQCLTGQEVQQMKSIRSNSMSV